jgi:molybdate transport system substrate-binding protein
MKKSIAVLSVFIGTWLSPSAFGADIAVLSAGAVEPGVKTALATFQTDSGHKAKLTFNTAPQIRKRIGEGEKWDIVIAPVSVIDEFTKAGKTAGHGVNLGRVGLGVAVRPGALAPDISSADALKQAVLDADSLVFNRASTGQYFEGLLKKMGVYEKVQGKTTRYADGAAVMEHVLKGKGKEIGFGPITEILLFQDRDLKYIGPLPKEVQNYTSYTAILTNHAKNNAAAQALLLQLNAAVSREAFKEAGIEQ